MAGVFNCKPHDVHEADSWHAIERVYEANGNDSIFTMYLAAAATAAAALFFCVFPQEYRRCAAIE